MSTVDVLVIAMSLAAGLGVVWLFLGRTPGIAVVGAGNAQDIRIVVRRGFHPDVVLVETGHPVRLHFFRDESITSSERIVFTDLAIERHLPAFETTTVEFTPSRAGDYRFRCGACASGVVAAQVGGEHARANLGRGHAKHG